MTEKCTRCGAEEEDLRTLWMACFYEMGELDISLEKTTLHVVDPELVKETVEPRRYSVTSYPSDGSKPVTTSGTYDHTARHAEPGAEVNLRGFYTMRVCKDCRAEWMGAIKQWFNQREPEHSSTGTGVFVRQLGACVELTPEEVARRFPA